MSKPDFKIITEKIVREYDPEAIVLFGSYAWGTPREESDVDLFIIKETDEPRIRRSCKIDKMFYPRDFFLDAIVILREK